MKNLKFKLAVFKGKKIYDVLNISWLSLDRLIVSVIVNNVVKEFNVPLEGELRQFTGMIDKNRREVYEYDLLKCDYGEELYQVLYNEKLGEFSVVNVLNRKEELSLRRCLKLNYYVF